MGRAKKEELAKVMGQRLKELRKATTDLGQKEVAAELGITKQAISNYESGRHIPDFPVVVDLANYYSCSVDYLLGLDDKINRSAIKYSERPSVNALLHALDEVAEDEGDYLVAALTGTIKAASIRKRNPQRRVFIAYTGECLDLLTEYIEVSTVSGNQLLEQAKEKSLNIEDVAVELARFSSFDDVYELIEEIRRTGIKAVLSFSANAKKALRIRTGWRNTEKEKASAKKEKYEKRFIEFMDREG